jgi:hypothetical protein
MNWRNSLFLFLLFLLFSSLVKAQTVYQEINKRSIYEFLDEMANLQLIELNTLIQPYPRVLIAEKLKNIEVSELNQRQESELTFFMREYNKELLKSDFENKRKDLFYHADTSFQLTVNPIVGGQFWTNQNGNYWHRWWGAEMFSYLGENWGFYASVRDQLESDQYLHENYLHRRNGAAYKGSGDFSDFRGGLTYSGKYGSIGLVKDLFSWGNHQFGSNVFSTKAPSFTRLKLQVKPTDWLELNYFHGWLNSEVIDSSRTYSAGLQNRKVMASKFIAANYLSLKPFKNFYFSLGNSIVYSDNFHPAFLIPFAFYKSVDHAIYAGGGNAGGANTQMFFDISSRNIKKVHLYSSFYIDEISFSRFWDADQHSNFVSGKLGAQWSNILNKNVSLTAEVTATNPMAYRHFVSTTTFASNQYTLGHYLGDDAFNLAFQVDYRPLAKLKLTAGLNLATKGNSFSYTGEGRDLWGLDFQEKIVWRRNQAYFSARYELINDLYLNARYDYREVSGDLMEFYSPDLFIGETHTFSGSVSLGF